mgnify:CR=1 FL=1
MKRKSLEKAVLLTVMLMSLHGIAGATDPVTADGENKYVQVVDKTVISANDTTGLNAINGGSITVNGSGQLVINKNQEENAIAIGTPKDVSQGEEGSSGTLTINDDVKLVVDMDINNIQKENTSGIYLTGNDSKLDIGAGGLQVDVTVNNSDAQYIRGINQEGGILTANGVIDVTMSAQKNALYVTGIDVRNYYNESKLYLNKGANITVTGNGNNTASAVGMYVLLGSELTANEKVTLNVSGAKINNGIIVGYTDVEKENLHLKNLEANISGGSETFGMQVHGGLAFVENANINATGGNDRNAGIWAWSRQNHLAEVRVGNTIIKVEGGKNSYGMLAQQGSSIKSSGDVKITAQNATKNYGVNANGGTIEMNGNNSTVIAQNGDSTYGIYLVDGEFNANNKLNVYALNGTNSNYGIYAYAGKVNVNDAEIISSGDKTTYGVVARNYNNIASEITFSGNASIEADIAARANGENCYVTFENGLIAGSTSPTQLQAMNGGLVKVNTSGNGTVQYNGVTHLETDNGSAVDMNINNKESYWNLTANSELRNFNIANNALLDMTKDSGTNSILYVTRDMSGDSGIIKMDVDATQDNGNDSLIIGGTHSGTHYLDLNVVNATADNDNVVGKVLASVADEQGEFKANDVEGALYWNSFELEAVNSQTPNYDKDWVIAGVNQKAENTTTVDTIVGANALNYQTWRAENDQLMQRMGELRANGADEQGAWFRVHGAEISHDDIAGFENKYTTYELGYDQITKQTEDMTRYTGAALSYTDGSSSYDSGNGENHSKALSFYNTDIYDSGHYLDLVFKFANMDNDFSVYDTKGQNITGEYKNNGISLSAEYGRKNDLKGGWYVEPQAQVTIGYFGGDEYETSNGVNVDQSGIASVLGRVGFNIGKQFGDNGVVYAKANLLHEFAGDYDIDMTDSAGNRRTESASFNDTWFEYGVGAALKTGKNNHLYFDFVKTAGGDFEKDWQWNAGMRWTF